MGEKIFNFFWSLVIAGILCLIVGLYIAIAVDHRIPIPMRILVCGSGFGMTAILVVDIWKRLCVWVQERRKQSKEIHL